MSFPNKANPHSSPNSIKTYAVINGLDDFANVLEKDFFAEVNFQITHCTETAKNDLVIEFYCNFGITESFHYFNNGSWGGFVPSTKSAKIKSSFEGAFEKLKQQNQGKIDIVETSLHFKDTSIIITRLYDCSIAEHIGSIIFKASEHFVYITKGLTEMPYEIFVPVFEDKKPNVFELDTDQRNYFHYWGLYFENDMQHDVMVYNLNTRQLRKEDFFLLE